MHDADMYGREFDVEMDLTDTAGAYAPAPLKTRKIERSDLPRTAHAMLAYANGLRTRPLVDLQLEDLLIQGLILSSQTLEELRAVQDTLNALKQEYVRRDPRLKNLFFPAKKF